MVQRISSKLACSKMFLPKQHTNYVDTYSLYIKPFSRDVHRDVISIKIEAQEKEQRDFFR